MVLINKMENVMNCNVCYKNFDERESPPAGVLEGDGPGKVTLVCGPCKENRSLAPSVDLDHGIDNLAIPDNGGNLTTVRSGQTSRS